jgi:hypothetical protein
MYSLPDADVDIKHNHQAKRPVFKIEGANQLQPALLAAIAAPVNDNSISTVVRDEQVEAFLHPFAPSTTYYSPGCGHVCDCRRRQLAALQIILFDNHLHEL